MSIDLDTGEVDGGADDETIGTGRPRKEGSRRTEKERADDRRRYRERKAAGGKSGKAADAEVASRASRVLARLADRRRSHGDDELADAILEDGPTIAQGVADITKAIEPLRIPLLMLLGIVEPIIAFARVGGILARRVAARRAPAQAVEPMGVSVTGEPYWIAEDGTPVNENGVEVTPT